MKVKIIKAKHQALWYADKIGKIVEVVNDVGGITFTCVENGHGIWIEDTEAIDKCGDCKSKKTCLMRDENKTWLRGMGSNE